MYIGDTAEAGQRPAAFTNCYSQLTMFVVQDSARLLSPAPSLRGEL